jgi:hypothetical protein
MIRTQIQIDERQYEMVRRMAHRKRISISEAVRRLIGRGLKGGDAEPEETGAGALLRIAGMGRSGLRDLGRRHDRYLAEQEGK